MQEKSSTGLQPHPAADLFPMMSDAELEDLASDIKANGLRNPIALTADGLILDGRNRYSACQLAEVEPVTITVNGVDPIAYVISQNVKRRNLTTAQKAIAAAEAWDMDALKLGQRSGRATWLGKQFGVSRAYVEQARALLERDPVNAAAVKRGDRTLTDAYEELRQRERKAEAASAKLQRLLAERPDLHELVQTDKLPLDDAMAIVEREEREEDEARQRLRGYAKDAFAFLSWTGTDEAGIVHADNVAHQLTATDITAADFRRAAWLAEKIADAMERQD